MIPQAQKFRKFRVRTYSTLAMIGGFIYIIYLGHVPLMLLIFTIQVGTAHTQGVGSRQLHAGCLGRSTGLSAHTKGHSIFNRITSMYDLAECVGACAHTH